MAKKNFKKGLNSLIESSLDDINELNNNKSEDKNSGKINIEDISDEKVKWLYIKMNRLEKELKLWRTGDLTVKIFRQTLQNKGLKYNPETNYFEEK